MLNKYSRIRDNKGQCYRHVALIHFNTSIHNDPSGQEPSTTDIKFLFVDNISSTSK